MSFRVIPSEIKDFATDLDELSAASAKAASYATHVKPNASGGSAFVRLLNSTTDVKPAIEAFFEHLQKLSTMSADELVATAKHYEDIDAEQAALADQAYQVLADTPVPKVGG